MRNYRQLSVIDWIVLTTRWVCVLVVSIWLAFVFGENWSIFLVPIAVAIYNLIATIWLAYNDSGFLFRFTSLVVDMFGAYLLYYMALSFRLDYLGWFSFLPLLVAALYFQWIGTLIITLINSFVLGGISYLFVS
jgi:hypothetical protein